MIEKHRIRPGMLLVRPSEAPKEQTTASGIVLPGSAAKEPSNGLVVLTGKELPSDPHGIKPGDLVYYGERSGQEITLYDIKYRLLQAKETISSIPKESLKQIYN